MSKEIDDFLKQFTAHDYLGDGAYVGRTDWDIVVFTTNGISIQNKVHLDKYSREALDRFIKREGIQGEEP